MNYSIISMFIKNAICLWVCGCLALSSVYPVLFFVSVFIQSLLLFSTTNIINGRAQGSMLLVYGFLMVIFWINYVIYVPC